MKGLDLSCKAARTIEFEGTCELYKASQGQKYKSLKRDSRIGFGQDPVQPFLNFFVVKNRFEHEITTLMTTL